MHYNTRMRKTVSDIHIADVGNSAKTPALSLFVVLLALLTLIMMLGIIIVLAKLVMG